MVVVIQGLGEKMVVVVEHAAGSEMGMVEVHELRGKTHVVVVQVVVSNLGENIQIDVVIRGACVFGSSDSLITVELVNKLVQRSLLFGKQLEHNLLDFRQIQL